MPVAAESGAQEHDAQVGERASGDPRGRVDACERHGGGALDVVVEAEHAIAVLVQQRVRVGREKVLELEQRARILLLHGPHEFLDEVEVRLAFQPLARIAEVQHVLAQVRVVRAHVEHHRQALPRRNARARGVERELADRNPHAVGAEIAQAQDPLPVGDDDDADVLLGPVVQNLRDAAAIVRRDEEALRLPGDVRKLPARLAHRGRVDQRHDLVEVIDHRAIEQAFVALLQRGQRHVLVDVPRHPSQALHHARHELRLGGDRVGQQSLESEAPPLGAGEGDGLVERLVVEDLGGSLEWHGTRLSDALSGRSGPRRHPRMPLLTFRVVSECGNPGDARPRLRLVHSAGLANHENHEGLFLNGAAATHTG